jgi:hypothetical protein
VRLAVRSKQGVDLLWRDVGCGCANGGKNDRYEYPYMDGPHEELPRRPEYNAPSPMRRPGAIREAPQMKAKTGNHGSDSLVLMVRLSMFKTILWMPALCAMAAAPVLADQWNKSFSVGAAPELRIETSDANVTLRAANVKTIEARVYTTGWRIGPGDVHVIDHQTGDLVEIEVKVPQMHFNFGNRSVKIDVQIPIATRTDVHTGDGNVRVDGLHGPAKLVTHDGNIDGEGFDGALDASSGDGNIRVRGKFSALNLRSGDGNIDAAVAPGSRMASGWTVHSGDGGVTLRLPDGFAANLDAHTGDGHITVNLPLTTEGGIHEDAVTGKLNGGGPVLTVRTGDGSVHLERL